MFYSKPNSHDKMGEDFDATGHLSRSVFDEVGIPRKADVYLCGPTRFMADMNEALAASGVAPERIHVGNLQRRRLDDSWCRRRSDASSTHRPWEHSGFVQSLPMGNNPLRAILAETIDFERLARAPMKLFITATNVRTGRGRVFKNNAVTPDVLLASACLPTMFQAVEIDGEPHRAEAILAIPRSRLSFGSANHGIPFSFRSIPLNAKDRRAPPQRFSTG